MQTLKTAVVVVLLLVVFYGVYEMLNSPPVTVPRDIVALDDSATAELDIDMGDFLDEPPNIGSPESTSTFDPSTSAIDGAGPVDRTGEMNTQSYEAPQGDSQYGPTAPGVGGANVAEPPGGAFSPPPTEPPAVPAQTPAPTTASGPTADAEVYVTPGNPQMQLNPHVNEQAVPKPRIAAGGSPQLGSAAYQRAMGKAQSLIADEKYQAALSELSIFYKSKDLTTEQQRQLLDLLDPLAGRVIYSREHLLARPYTVGRNETLMEIAQQFQVPYQLLQKINGIENPSILLPGSELKIVPGPFSADVDLPAQELTLFVNGLYAGRFPITLGVDPQPITGEFQVRAKQPGKTYFSMDGRTIPSDSPANPFGRVWLDLGREVCIHGSPAGGGPQQRGCISLSPRDADDVYSILSVGSKVRILR